MPEPRLQQSDMAEWLQLLRDLLRGRLKAIYVSVSKEGDLWVKKHQDVEHEKLQSSQED